MRKQEKQNIQDTSTNTNNNPPVRKTCKLRYCKDNKASKICDECGKYVCEKCTVEKPIICKKITDQIETSTI